MKYVAGLFIGSGMGVLGIMLHWWDATWFLVIADIVIGAVLFVIASIKQEV